MQKKSYKRTHSNAWFPIYGLMTVEENPLDPPWASTQDAGRLKSDCLIRWKIPGVERIISSPFRFIT